MSCQTRRAMLTMLVACTCVSLNGCMSIAIGGAAVVGMAAMDRRTVGTQLDDVNVELRLGHEINVALGEHARISVTSYNSRILLTGQASDEAGMRKAEQIVQSHRGVKKVDNEILLTSDRLSFVQRSADTLLSSKVRANLISENGMPASAFKVVTENKVVYLLGIATRNEAIQAAEVIRQVGDVRKVVLLIDLQSG